MGVGANLALRLAQKGGGPEPGGKSEDSQRECGSPGLGAWEAAHGSLGASVSTSTIRSDRRSS